MPDRAYLYECRTCGDMFSFPQIGSFYTCSKCLDEVKNSWRQLYDATTPEEVRRAMMLSRDRYVKYIIRSHRRAIYYLQFALLGWSVAALIAIVNYFRP